MPSIVPTTTRPTAAHDATHARPMVLTYDDPRDDADNGERGMRINPGENGDFDPHDMDDMLPTTAEMAAYWFAVTLAYIAFIILAGAVCGFAWARRGVSITRAFWAAVSTIGG